VKKEKSVRQPTRSTFNQPIRWYATSRLIEAESSAQVTVSCAERELARSWA